MISLTELKKHPKIEHDAEDELVRQYEAAAVSMLQRLTGRYFGPPELVTEHFSLTRPDQNTLLLRNAPLAEDAAASPMITAPLVERRSGGDYEVVEEEDYVVENDEIVLLGDQAYWPMGVRQVRVTYWRGYVPYAEPADIRQAVLLLTAHLYENRAPLAGTVGQQSVLPYSLEAIVHSYRRVRA